jgi:hypothetical protein
MQAVEPSTRNWLQEMEKKRSGRERARLMLEKSEQVDVNQRRSIRSSRLPIDSASSRKTQGTEVFTDKAEGIHKPWLCIKTN